MYLERDIKEYSFINIRKVKGTKKECPFIPAKKNFKERPLIFNRKGVIEQFPLTSISIGVVVADKKRFSNTLEIGEVGAQVKHLAKTTMGSSYAINRREEYK